MCHPSGKCGQESRVCVGRALRRASHAPKGGVTLLLLPNRHPKKDSEEVHHKTLKAMDLEFKENQTLQAIE